MKVWVNDLNTTNFRIVVSVVLAAITALMLLVGVTILNWFPTEPQLKVIFYLGVGLLIMMGLDVTQFVGKRFSDSGYAAAKNPSPVTVEAPSKVEVDTKQPGKPAVKVESPEVPAVVDEEEIPGHGD